MDSQTTDNEVKHIPGAMLTIGWEDTSGSDRKSRSLVLRHGETEKILAEVHWNPASGWEVRVGRNLRTLCRPKGQEHRAVQAAEEWALRATGSLELETRRDT